MQFVSSPNVVQNQFALGGFGTALYDGMSCCQHGTACASLCSNAVTLPTYVVTTFAGCPTAACSLHSTLSLRPIA